jgi:hypothetical protein
MAWRAQCATCHKVPHLLEQELRGDSPQQHVAALHRYQVQSIEPPQGRHGLINHGRPRRHHSAHRQGPVHYDQKVRTLCQAREGHTASEYTYTMSK